MKKTSLILVSVFTLAMFAGVFLCKKSAGADVSPWNVEADVVHNGQTFHYNLADNLPVENAQNRGIFLSSKGKKMLAKQLLEQGLPNGAVFEYLLPNFKDVLHYFHFLHVEKRDATVSFDANGFAYTKEIDGVEIDAEKLFFCMLESGGKRITVQLPLTVHKAVTTQQLQQNTVVKGTFTTYFVASNQNRAHNVQLAACKLNGVTVGVGQSFSFNQIVGPRSAENGYLQSKVILDGMYADGIGGGVCQVSTTLYNALLLSEIIPQACQHSLASSYVLAGFDAMVSDGGADLVFTNNTGYPLYIASSVNLQNKSVTFTVYGTPNNYRVERESISEIIPFETVQVVDRQKYPELVYFSQTKVVVNGIDGVKSQSFLNYYNGNTLVERKLIRQNVYKTVNKIVAHGYLKGG